MPLTAAHIASSSSSLFPAHSLSQSASMQQPSESQHENADDAATESHQPAQDAAAPSFEADASASAAAAAASAEDDAPSCMICLESTSTRQTGRLYRPCPCSHVHVACLAEWRSLAPNAARCPSCKTPYRLRRERWARVLGHPVTAVAATAIAVGLSATAVTELVRLVMRVPRPAGLPAQLLFIGGSAWRAAEVCSGALASLLALTGCLQGGLDTESAELLADVSWAWVSGVHTSGWTRGIASIGTGAFCIGAVALAHHYIRQQMKARLIQAAEQVLDVSDW